jgi:7-keto-8-aminopelargonate synthetase-like enzyme
VTDTGHEFLNMCSCSYLGLNRDPRIVAAAERALRDEGTMSISVSRARIAPALLDTVEALLAEVFGCDTIITPSCFSASAGTLPVLASGHMTGERKPFMVFDRNAHFSMNAIKPVCGDETEVVTCAHNDVEFLEQACRKHPVVVYVSDGSYSMGGTALINELLRLQDRYGLFLYLDDSHSISVHGERGEGFIRSHLPEVTDRTVIVGSLAKAFGATGGVIMVGARRHRELLEFFGGPLGWSQMLSAPGLGAIAAAAEIHLSPELAALQARLREVLALLDEVLPTANAGDELPIRVIELAGTDDAVKASGEIFRRGFYSSAVFFPIVARGRAGLRAMGRADMEDGDIRRFGAAVREIAVPVALSTSAG